MKKLIQSIDDWIWHLLTFTVAFKTDEGSLECHSIRTLAAFTAVTATITVHRSTVGLGRHHHHPPEQRHGRCLGGKVQALLLGSASVTTSIGSGTCTSSTMLGTVNSNGTALNISAASFSSPPAAGCSGTVSSTITANVLRGTVAT